MICVYICYQVCIVCWYRSRPFGFSQSANCNICRSKMDVLMFRESWVGKHVVPTPHTIWEGLRCLYVHMYVGRSTLFVCTYVFVCGQIKKSWQHTPKTLWFIQPYSVPLTLTYVCTNYWHYWKYYCVPFIYIYMLPGIPYCKTCPIPIIRFLCEPNSELQILLRSQK